MQTRTAEQIARQVAGLKKERASLPQRSGLGTENWKIIDAQIDVLNGDRKPSHFYEDETAEEFIDGDNDIYFASEEAQEWLNGSRTNDLFDSESEPPLITAI